MPFEHNYYSIMINFLSLYWEKCCILSLVLIVSRDGSKFVVVTDCFYWSIVSLACTDYMQDISEMPLMFVDIIYVFCLCFRHHQQHHHEYAL
jgi:hypothetical protein